MIFRKKKNIVSMEIPNYNFFINREKNKPCLVAGCAPSIKNFPFKKFKGIYIFMNFGPILCHKLAKPNYWVSANSYFPVPTKHYRKINVFKDCIYMFSDTATYFEKHKYDYNLLKKKLEVPWFAFDCMHFNHQKCNPPRPCCDFLNLYPERITIHEFIQRHFGLPERCPVGNTGALFSLAFAILMGCSPIYLQGIELPLYRKHHYLYNMSHPAVLKCVYYLLRSYVREWVNGKPEYSCFYEVREQTLQAFEYMANLCHKLEREIYNLSPTSVLNEVKALPYLDYRKVCV